MRHLKWICWSNMLDRLVQLWGRAWNALHTGLRIITPVEDPGTLSPTPMCVFKMYRWWHLYPRPTFLHMTVKSCATGPHHMMQQQDKGQCGKRQLWLSTGHCQNFLINATSKLVIKRIWTWGGWRFEQEWRGRTDDTNSHGQQDELRQWTTLSSRRPPKR